MPRGPTKSYEYRIEFDAPLPFVFRWCTDYRADDARLEGETFARRILKKTRRAVVYEDLESGPNGWWWARHDISLDPPSHWHSSSVGNYRQYELDYRLRERPGGKTELRFVGRRGPGLLGSAHPTTAVFRRSMDKSWKLFRTALEKEYRASRRRRGN